MKRFALVFLAVLIISANSFAKYPKEQLVLLQDLKTGGGSPFEDDGKFVWTSETDSYSKDIFYFDGLETIRITNDTNKEIIEDFWNGEILYRSDVDGDYDVYLYKDGEIKNLSNNDIYDGYVDRDGNRICWMSGTTSDSNDNEVYLYEDGIVKRITNNDYREYYPKLNKDYLVWAVPDDGETGDRFFIYKDGKTVEYPFDILFSFSGMKYILTDRGIIWQGCDGGENCSETGGVDLDHEIFLYDFENITQLSDTPDAEEAGFKASNDLIIWYSVAINQYNEEYECILYFYNYKDILEYKVSQQQYGGLGWSATILNDDKALFRDEIDGIYYLYLFDGETFQPIHSDSASNYFTFGFTLDGVGLNYEVDDYRYTYLYKDEKKELIFDAFSSPAGFYDNYITFSYKYPDRKLYKSVFLDPQLPYFILEGNESYRLRKGDQLNLGLKIENPGPERVVDVYIIEILGECPFCETRT